MSVIKRKTIKAYDLRIGDKVVRPEDGKVFEVVSVKDHMSIIWYTIASDGKEMEFILLPSHEVVILDQESANEDKEDQFVEVELDIPVYDLLLFDKIWCGKCQQYFAIVAINKTVEYVEVEPFMKNGPNHSLFCDDFIDWSKAFGYSHIIEKPNNYVSATFRFGPHERLTVVRRLKKAKQSV